MNKSNLWLSIQTIVAALILGIFLNSCQSMERSKDLPSHPESPAPTSLAADELPLEWTPSNTTYAVTGVTPGDSLSIYSKPSSSSDILGEIPSSGTNIRPISNIQSLEESQWLQVQYLDLSGWVDFSSLAEQYGNLPDEVVLLGQEVLLALKNYRYDLLADKIHPSLCLRFSPYSYLNEDNQIICGSEIAAESQSDLEHLWGSYDGTGNPIHLSFNAYHQTFIYDQDYLNAEIIGLNREVSSGNSINNISDIYPDGMMIEYHFPEIDPQYAGLDWRSIRLVFVQSGANWYLVAIIHGEWTI